MTAAAVYFLFAVVAGDLPNLIGLASYGTLEACKSAEASITATLKTGEHAQQLVCVASDSMAALAKANPM